MKIKTTLLSLAILGLIAGLLENLGGAQQEQEGEMREKLQVLLDGREVIFSSPPVRREGAWIVPLESFCQLIGAHVDYPEGANQAVVCREGKSASEPELCVPLPFEDPTTGVVRIDGVLYVAPSVLAEPFGLQVQTPAPDRLEIVAAGFKADASPLQGTLAPDFTLPDLEGKPRRLSEFRGRKTLLYLWASW